MGGTALIPRRILASVRLPIAVNLAMRRLALEGVRGGVRPQP